jgi:lysophospholipase L1-like esterase
VIFEHGQRIVFIGDSITDSGRRDFAAPYGDGYMNLVRSFVTASRPDLGLQWTNTGINGDTVRDLARRWDDDAIAEQPDWLSVMVGINDVWRAFDGSPELAVPIDEYEDTLRTLLQKAQTATGCRLILATPYLIEPDRAEPQRAESDRYRQVMLRLADEFGAIGIDTQAAFDQVLEHTPPTAWADDRVHPNLPGHAILAQLYLRAVGWSL